MALSLEQQAIETISRAKHLLIVARSASSIDDLSACIGLGFWLKQLNKSFDIVIPDYQESCFPHYVPKSLAIQQHLGALRTLQIRLNVEQVPLSELSYHVENGKLDITLVPKMKAWSPSDVSFSSGAIRYDAIVTIGVPDRHALESVFTKDRELLHELTTINIDSSPTNEQWGTINLVNPTRSSTCESLFTLLEAWNPQRIDSDIATALLAGMISATKGFRSHHLSGKTLERSSTLLERGARRQEIISSLWRTKTISDLQLWGTALSRIEQKPEIGLAWLTIMESDLLLTKASMSSLEGLLTDVLSYSPTSRISILFKQEHDHWMVELFSHAPYSAIEVAKDYSPRGNQEICYFKTSTSQGDLLAQREHVISTISKSLRT